MLFSTHSYEKYVTVKKQQTAKRKIRLSRSSPKDWLETKFIRMAAFLLFAVAVYTFSMGDVKIGPARHQDVESQNNHRLVDHPKTGHRK